MDATRAGSPPPVWHPHTGAVAFAVVWPVFLFVAIEILARTTWKPGARWIVLRFGGLIPVAAVAAVVSYRHLSGLLDFYGEDALTVAIGPLAVDGLMVMATGALIATSNIRRATTTSTEQEIAPTPANPIPTPAPVNHPAPTDAPPPAAEPPATKPAPRPAVKTGRTQTPRRPASAAKVAKAAARMPGASVAAIAAKAGVSESTARRHLTAADRPARAATVASRLAARPAPTPDPTEPIAAEIAA
jgi:hypothetical protein